MLLRKRILKFECDTLTMVITIDGRPSSLQLLIKRDLRWLGIMDIPPSLFDATIYRSGRPNFLTLDESREVGVTSKAVRLRGIKPPGLT